MYLVCFMWIKEKHAISLQCSWNSSFKLNISLLKSLKQCQAPTYFLLTKPGRLCKKLGRPLVNSWRDASSRRFVWSSDCKICYSRCFPRHFRIDLWSCNRFHMFRYCLSSQSKHQTELLSGQCLLPDALWSSPSKVLIISSGFCGIWSLCRGLPDTALNPPCLWFTAFAVSDGPEGFRGKKAPRRRSSSLSFVKTSCLLPPFQKSMPSRLCCSGQTLPLSWGGGSMWSLKPCKFDTAFLVWPHLNFRI